MVECSRARRLCIGMVLVATAMAAATHRASAAGPVSGDRIPVKVMVINMFGLEAAPWIAALHPERSIRVPGLARPGQPPDMAEVRCTVAGVCQLTTGMGHVNAAASMMAVLYSGLFDFKRTYFIVAGIGGIDPERGTIGSVAWARFLVDGGIAHEIDPRELPPNWHDGYFGVLTNSPDAMPKLEYGTEVFRLDETLLQKALALSQGVVLEDSPTLAAYRQHYTQPAARRPPSVLQCDTLTSDTWWAGRRLGERARHWTQLVTKGAGTYCTSQQEDNATFEAMIRASESDLIDLQRVAVMRSGSDFDRPYPGQSVLSSLQTQGDLPGAMHAATENLLRAGMPLVDAIQNHWDEWQAGVPAK
jgi:purine nucleoside permease